MHEARLNVHFKFIGHCVYLFILFHYIFSIPYLLFIVSRGSQLCTYLLTPWCRVLLEKLTVLQLVKKFPAFHGTRRFITALTSVRHLSLSWTSPNQSIYSRPTSWSSILILSTHLGLVSPVVSSPVSPPRPYTPPLLTHTRNMPNPSHSSLFYHPHNIGWGVQIHVKKFNTYKLIARLHHCHIYSLGKMKAMEIGNIAHYFLFCSFFAFSCEGPIKTTIKSIQMIVPL